MEVNPMVADALVVGARRCVRELGLRHQDAQQVLHDDRLALFLEERVAAFGVAEGTAKESIQIARLAALFYPLGQLIDKRAPLKAAQSALADFLKQTGGEALKEAVQACLQGVYEQRPETPAAMLLADALIAIYLNDEVYNWADLRALEYDLRNGSQAPRARVELRLQELLNLRFHTSAGKMYWQELLARQILLQRKRLEKISRNTVEDTASEERQAFGEIEENVPFRGAQTYFRAVYRNHINLSAIADNKANIMISVNAILISVLITFLSYRNIAETQPMVLLPVVVFLMTGLASLVGAVLSARPKVTRLDMVKGDHPSGLAFFGNFARMPLEEFTAAMDKTLQSGPLLYANMVEDLYHLGRVLDRKYRYLSISYNTFMVGLIVTVLLFLVTLL